ncbi:uncharacterized protein BYT42DRAFT_617407 [Radiomyces spectabilis]|uniref:uncharacterized protein n=1 Tax=Radiomyces spectabilis TaxID=64574 RepID=UPI002220F37E|nr:uncharacterized protein BYT42DRAFT_617407 [Radiomyces spectabilis]KAI8369377.1 hypothetical protein BYT42DRAFT_617407 [Radiomyces spectabilis]
MRIATILGVLSVLLWSTQALPVFEIVNDKDRYGNACPLKPSYNVSCPLLCVTDYSLCPPALAPTCPPGLSFCTDGECHSSCEGISNECLCTEAALPMNYVPCAAGQHVNITHFDPNNKDQQTQDTCAKAAQLNASDVGVWGTFNQSSIWLQCPVIEPRFTFTEPRWIAVWAIMGAEAAILILWHLYKLARETKFHRALDKPLEKPASPPNLVNEKEVAMANMAATNGSISDEKAAFKKNNAEESSQGTFSDRSSDSASLKDSERLRFRGFQNDFFGLFAFGSVIIITLLFVVFLAVLVSDYYGNLTGVELAAFLSSDMSSKIFCAVWHLAAAWFAVVLLCRKRIRNYFRIESYAHKCPFVQVERRQEELVFLADGSKWINKLKDIEQRIIKRLGMDILVSTCPVHLSTNNLRYFEYQCMRYVYNAEKGRFEPYEFDLGCTHRKLRSWSKGVSSDVAHNRLELLGANLIRVEVPSIPLAIIQEFASFLYLYQMMCMWVWYYFQYFKMGLVQTCIIFAAAFIRVFLRLRAEYRIKQMAEQKTTVNVLRDGEWIENMSSADMVPGDVFEVQEQMQVSCDAVILSGTIVVNESSLTGEAMPIRKFSIPDDDNTYELLGSGKVNTLFAGTSVSQTMPAINEQRVTALALRTGITSEKGMLIHKILFPTPVSFIFNEHLKLAICILLLWGGIAFALTLYLMGRGNITSWYYGVFIMSQIFSPLLPAAFTINQSVCAARLRTKKILCIDLPRINLSGKVRIFCFDKTGTLTREGLEFYGAVAACKNESRSFLEREEDSLAMEPTLALGIATCHAVTKVKDQFIGNPVDIESFHAMKWELLPPADNLYLDTLVPPAATPNDKPVPVHIVRRFEFVHARASQSVAVLDPKDDHVHVFLKGSFERVKNLSRSESIPPNYDQVAAKYAQEGCYVLAMAHRDLGKLGDDITMAEIKKMTRDDLEEGCDFTGFVLFRNMLKHDTADAIAELKEGDTRTVMITGDTALTGIFIARQCGMIAPGQTVLLGDAVNGSMIWHDVDSGDQVNVDEVLAADPREEHDKQVELAITGRAFEFLISRNQMRQYLLHTRIFARMTPNDKVQCVQLHMEKGVTAMCGDGGNDCGALRAAHVGLALSEAEASIVSPFSTSNRSIMQCVELLRQGRAAIATSFANYKFLIFYGESMAFWELLMFYFTVIAPQSIWITIDGFITTTMTFAITQAQPAAKLGPSRPTAKPLGAYTLASCFGIIFINFWFITMSVVWLFQQDWFVCNEFDSSAIDSAQWWLLGDNYESEIISLVIIFQFFNNGALVNFGSVFRQAWWRNYTLVFIWCCFFVSTSYMMLADPNPYGCMFRINCGTPRVLEELGYPKPTWSIEEYNAPLGHNVLPRWFRWQLWGYVVANCAANLIWERIVILWIARDWAIKKNQASPKKNRAIFKL